MNIEKEKAISPQGKHLWNSYNLWSGGAYASMDSKRRAWSVEQAATVTLATPLFSVQITRKEAGRVLKDWRKQSRA